MDINVTTDTLGHVTDANATFDTRTLTLANLGYTGATNANNYVHPTHPGDDLSIDTGALTGATVISDLDINVTTDTSGHVTDANATVATRNLTLANLGYTGATNANYITNNNQLANGAGYTTNAGTITGITTSAGLDGAGSSGSINISLDLSELTDMTADVIPTTDEIILLDNGAERRKLFSEIFGSAAYVNTTNFATSAQGANADAAYGWGNHASAGYLTTETYTAHENTSNLSGSYGGNNNGIVIEDITVDANGHVTAVGTRDLDSRFAAASHTHSYDNYNNWKLGDGAASFSDVRSVNYVQFVNSTISGSGTAGDPYMVNTPDTNTTYSVGDGGLTQKNFTTTLKNKLDGIAAGAEVNVQSDWNASSGDAAILNKPSIPSAVTVTNTETASNLGDLVDVEVDPGRGELTFVSANGNRMTVPLLGFM